MYDDENFVVQSLSVEMHKLLCLHFTYIASHLVWLTDLFQP